MELCVTNTFHLFKNVGWIWPILEVCFHLIKLCDFCLCSLCQGVFVDSKYFSLFMCACIFMILTQGIFNAPKVKTHIRKCKTWIEFQKKKLFKSCILPKRLQHPGMIDVCIFITPKNNLENNFLFKKHSFTKPLTNCCSHFYRAIYKAR